jgi:hypothetical protein
LQARLFQEISLLCQRERKKLGGKVGKSESEVSRIDRGVQNHNTKRNIKNSEHGAPLLSPLVVPQIVGAQTP